MIRQYWWKILGVLILVYVIIVGMLVPLKSGILSSFPLKTEAGQQLILEVEGYNTHFSTAKHITAFLKNGKQEVVGSSKVDVGSETTALLTFDMPAKSYQPRESLTLIMNNEIDGSSILPAAVVFQESSKPITNDSVWQTFEIAKLYPSTGFKFPFRNILHETVRNTFFHVAIWFAMLVMFIVGLIYSIKYLRNSSLHNDAVAVSFTRVGILFGVVGLATGSVWAKYTWGAFWTSDVKLNMSAIAILIYLAYLILRNSIGDVDTRARVASSYNIFAFCMLIPLIMIVPRMTDSLHPGNGGNPALGDEDMDNTLRAVFYPAIIGLTLLGVWMSTLTYRIYILKERWIEE